MQYCYLSTDNRCLCQSAPSSGSTPCFAGLGGSGSGADFGNQILTNSNDFIGSNLSLFAIVGGAMALSTIFKGGRK